MSGNDESEPPEHSTGGQADETSAPSTEADHEPAVASDGFARADTSPGAERTGKESEPPADTETVDSVTTDDLREQLEDVDAAALTVPPQSLNPKVRIVWIVQSLISATFLGVIAGAIEFAVLDVGIWVGPAVFGVFALLGVVHAILRYRVWEYEVREDALYLERGVITRVRTVVPYVRIQHVDASRGPVERLVGLASSVVYTAGSRGADVTIPGLTADGADDLQHRLKQMAILAEGDDAV
ncbi:putative membrane protein YdbS, contains bPH2 (bacterial pleckstrin homology) domain [Natranaeroarchaeum sulfidigenes]|uniref:Putative membrane protein YdbS, contains bPH2 (Bacterial pleckstrin homology) domain n=1 Tax=Natranaeroarchaeum sulfidigenes TaxID=2784880 RepID=A0A897MI54_9EURY|nr:putative membrane protein YdbS, contains bPH2 (bacterial pleckstrin homology) domain [Natranaeroarchaeum sulfidigenes]